MTKACHLVLRRGTFPFECTGKQKKLSILGKREARFVPGKAFTWRKGYSVGGMSSAGIIGPFFFEDESGDVAIINSDRYLRLLRTKWLPALQRKRNNNTGGLWYQQDGATPHRTRHVLAWLEQTFGEQFISFRTAREWPPHCPDLNP